MHVMDIQVNIKERERENVYIYAYDGHAKNIKGKKR